MQEQEQPQSPMVMTQMVTSFWVSQSIYVAAKLGISDQLAQGPKTSEELAASVGAHAPSLYRLLRGLASVGVYREDETGQFHLTPLAELLQSDVLGSMRALALSEVGPDHYLAWSELLHSVQTGQTAFPKVFGMEVFPYYEQHPEVAQAFNASMTAISAVVNPAVVEAYDFSSLRRVADVGGGHGSLLAAVLKANPALQGVLFDQPSVVAGVESLLSAEGVAGRCEVVGGDFFASMPVGCDAYLLKAILHDWDEERAGAILQSCRRAMAPAGKVLLIETVIPRGNDPDFGKLLDLNMLVMTGGRERTQEEFGALLEAAGFNLSRVVPTKSPFSIVEGVAV